ncbi:MAG: MMPL family transporter [Deltaproteobacteria bacterium]|nr:MMPL family transporter [Deltaproteobacteria bacterium]
MSHLPKVLSQKTRLRFIVDHPFHLIILGLIITLLFAWQLPNLRIQTSIYDLAIEDLPETTLYESFKKEFGTEEIILVVARGTDIFDENAFQKIDHLARKFSRIKGIRKVLSLPGIKKDMDVTEKWTLADFEKIIGPVSLFAKNLLSADKKTTVLTLLLEDVTTKDRIIESVEEIIVREGKGISLYQIGMPLVSKALAEYTKKDFLRLPPITFLVIAIILFCFFRNFRGVLIPMGSVLVALIWTFGLMAWTHTPLSMLTMIVPIFIIAVGTAYCMYILPEYMAAIEKYQTPREASFACFEHIAFPTTLAVITTTIGLGSLLLNRITAIREFALFSCFGIWSMLIIMLILLPAVFALLPIPGAETARDSSKKGLLDTLLDKIIHINLHRQKIVLPLIALIALVAIGGIFRIKVETNPVGYFRESTPISRQFHDIYQDMAGSFPLNVVLDSRSDDYFEDPAHLRTIARIQKYFDTLEGVDKTISFADYFKLINYASNNYEKAFYALPQEGFEVRMLMNNFKTMLGQDTFDRFMNKSLSKTSILLRTHIASSDDFLRTKKAITAFLQDALPEGFDHQVTGFGIVISQSSRILTDGQVKSLSVTLVLIFGIMFLLFLSIKVGFIAILPNCFPIIMNFGLMGWLGIELSLATSLVASIAIGLAVDDTIHYLVRYNREFKKDLKKERALRDTLKGVGRPIIFTTLTIGLGFSVLLFSHFKPTAVFGLLMVITMGSALIGDLILLPSLMTHVELITIWDLLRLKLGKDPEKGIPLFEGLSRTQVHYIIMAGALRKFETGEVLFNKGDVSDSMYAIISGELEVVDFGDDSDEDGIQGTKKLISILRLGDVVGEMGMVRSCRRSATVITTAPTELLQINDRMVRRLHWLYPPTAQKFFFNLMAIICDKLEFTTQCLADITTVDGLTGLQNRDYFMEILEKEMERAIRYGSELSVCMIALDNLKGINHTYGRHVGDKILSGAAKLLSSQVRKNDQVCRYSGQTFALLLINSPLEDTQKVFERFRKQLSQHVFGGEDTPVYVPASVGFTTLRAGTVTSAEELMGMASESLAKARELDRNQVVGQSMDK